MGHETKEATPAEQLQHWFDKAWNSVGIVRNSALSYFKRVIEDIVASDDAAAAHKDPHDKRDAA